MMLIDSLQLWLRLHEEVGLVQNSLHYYTERLPSFSFKINLIFTNFTPTVNRETGAGGENRAKRSYIHQK